MQVRSQSTRVAEVENPTRTKSWKKPIGPRQRIPLAIQQLLRARRIRPRVFVSVRVALVSRDIPIGLGWLIEPFISSVPRDSLEFTLRALRTAITP